MKIKITRNTAIKGRHVVPGEVVEVEDAVGRELINIKKAEAAKAPPPAKPKAAKKKPAARGGK